MKGEKLQIINSTDANGVFSAPATVVKRSQRHLSVYLSETGQVRHDASVYGSMQIARLTRLNQNSFTLEFPYSNYNKAFLHIFRDHPFDKEERQKPNRIIRFGIVSGPSMPSRGARSVREFHHRDESKILKTKRLGKKLNE